VAQDAAGHIRNCCNLIRTGLILRVYLVWLKGISIQQTNKKTLVSASINDDQNIPAISEEIGDDWKTSRLTCEYKPEQYDPEFDYDSLLLYSEMNDRSEKDECTICEKQKTCCTSIICADCWNPIRELINYKSPDDSYKEEDVWDEIAASIFGDRIQSGLEEYMEKYTEEYQKIRKYAPNAKINDAEKMFYMERCHCCGDEDILWGQTYCSERCRKAVEDDGCSCGYRIYGFPCKICESSTIISVPDFLEEWVYFNKKRILMLEYQHPVVDKEMMDNYTFTKDDIDSGLIITFKDYKFAKSYSELCEIDLRTATRYMWSCHCCGSEIIPGQIYCSESCRTAISEGFSCYLSLNDHSCNICKTSEIMVPDFMRECYAFNKSQNKSLVKDSFDTLKKYAERNKMSLEIAYIYIWNCHCCGKHMENPLWGQTYCSERCREAIETDDHECINSVQCRDCLICEKTTDRDYDESRSPPSFIQVPQRICGCCADVFSYPPFQYYEYDYEYIPSPEDDCDDPEFDIRDIGKTVSACIDCFCKNSKIERKYRQNFPLIDHPGHHPLISAVYVLQKMYIYNKIDDLQVWSDLLSYME
jgi:hypothetical protein